MILTANPAAGAASPCDGPINMVGQDATFAAIVAAGGNQGGLEGDPSDSAAGVRSSATSNQFAELKRGFFNFDTSALGAGAVISAAKLSLVCNFKTNALGDDSYDVVQATPDSPAALPNTDFPHVGSTSFANVPYGSIDSGGGTYTDWNLNASGIAAINKTGITSLALRSHWDLTGTFGGVWTSSAETRMQILYADNGSNEPTLTITYTTGGSSQPQTLTITGVGS